MSDPTTTTTSAPGPDSSSPRVFFNLLHPTLSTYSHITLLRFTFAWLGFAIFVQTLYNDHLHLTTHHPDYTLLDHFQIILLYRYITILLLSYCYLYPAQDSYPSLYRIVYGSLISIVIGMVFNMGIEYPPLKSLQYMGLTSHWFGIHAWVPLVAYLGVAGVGAVVYQGWVDLQIAMAAKGEGVKGVEGEGVKGVEGEDGKSEQ